MNASGGKRRKKGIGLGDIFWKQAEAEELQKELNIALRDKKMTRDKHTELSAILWAGTIIENPRMMQALWMDKKID